MQISEEQLAGAKLHPFAWLRLLDLNDHVATRENFLCCCGDFCPGGAICVVICHDARASA